MNKTRFLTLVAVILLVSCQNSIVSDTSTDDVASTASGLLITYAASDSSSSVTQNLGLPTSAAKGVSINWSSSSPSVVSNAGVVTRPEAGQYNAPVILTATLTKNSASDTKTFSIVVKGLAPVNVAKAKPVESDSEQTNNLATFGNDGNYQTRWCAIDGNHNHWYILNLQKIYGVKLSKVYWEFSGEYRYQILGSNDKQIWIHLVDRSKNTEWTTMTTDPINANYQYFKIVILSALKHKPQPENTWDSFYEWELY